MITLIRREYIPVVPVSFPYYEYYITGLYVMKLELGNLAEVQ